MGRFFGMKQNFRYYARQLMHSGKRTFSRRKTEVNTSPVIITGNQKTGTSAIAALLAKATGTMATIDVFAKMGRVEYDVLDKKMAFREFRDAADTYFSSSIVKEPEFIFFMDQLLELYPTSNFVYIVRSPHENIRSIMNRLSPAKNSGEVEWSHIRKACRNAPLWELVFDSSRMPYKVGGVVETLAHRWVFAHEQLWKHSGRVVTVSYEGFKLNKVAVITSLANALDMPVKHSIEEFKDVQFQPAGHTSNKVEFFCESDARLIDEICGDYEASLSDIFRYGGCLIK